MDRIQPGNNLRSSYYARYLMHHTKRNLALILLGALMLAGILAGTLLLRGAGEEVQALLLRMVNGYVEKRASRLPVENFLGAATPSLIFLGILFISGFCAIAQPLELLIPLFRGLGYGFSIGSLYIGYGSRAMGYIALYILPGMMLSSVALLLCCVESLRLSAVFLKTLGGSEERKREGYSLRLYLARYLAAIFICLFAAILEAAFCALFGGVVYL